MATRTFPGSRVRQADYDPASRQLELQWADGSVLAYAHVPEEVFRRLCSAPNPATYWEDRIAEEYPKATPKGRPARATGPTLKDLFGGAADEPAD